MVEIFKEKPKVENCENCGLREECPIYCGFCNQMGFCKIGKCSVCGKENILIGKHGNMKTGYWVCSECAVACMY